VSFSTRLWLSDLALSHQFVREVQDAKWSHGDAPGVHWKGIPNLKDPFDLAIVPLLLWELRPATVIELGAYEGGSAIWMADLLGAMGIESRIYSIDVDLGRVTARHPMVQFVEADLMRLETLASLPLESLPHPWLLIDDAHVNTYAVLEHFHRHLRSGDYLVMEDTIYHLEKHRELARFLAQHDDHYRVDRRFTDLFGYNATFNFNGYLRRV
jgi:cephalosporin hydroxylase